MHNSMLSTFVCQPLLEGDLDVVSEDGDTVPFMHFYEPYLRSPKTKIHRLRYPQSSDTAETNLYFLWIL